MALWIGVLVCGLGLLVGLTFWLPIYQGVMSLVGTLMRLFLGPGRGPTEDDGA